MQKIQLFRYMTGDQGTVGLWVMPNRVYDTLELPWRKNYPNISCIPPGTYRMEFVKTRRYHSGRNQLYLVMDVPDRSGILNHAGTWAGDRAMGYKSDVRGCILTGLSVGMHQGQLAVFNTRRAVGEIIDRLNGAPAELTISEVF